MLERLAHATGSGNLAWSDTGTRDVDYIAALGAIAQHNELQSAVVRLMGGDKQAVRKVQDILWRKLGRAHSLSIAEQHDVSLAVYWHLDNVCPECMGRHGDDSPHTSLQIASTPSLRAEACPSCQGSGKRPHGANSETYAKALDLLERAQASVGFAVREKI